MRKPFDKKLHESNDRVAREAVKKAFFRHYGYILEDNPDIYGPDLKAYEDGYFIGYVEVEVKQFWKDYAHFPDKFLHIPHRKSKFLDLDEAGSNVPIIFCVLSSNLKAGYWVDNEDLSNCHIIEKSNKYVDNEKFFNIPLEKMQYFLV